MIRFRKTFQKFSPHFIGTELLGLTILLDMIISSSHFKAGYTELNPFMIPFAYNPVSHAWLKVGILVLILLLVLTIQLGYKIPDNAVLIPYLIVSWLFISVSIHNIVLFTGWICLMLFREKGDCLNLKPEIRGNRTISDSIGTCRPPIYTAFIMERTLQGGRVPERSRGCDPLRLRTKR